MRCAASHDLRSFAQPEACAPRKERGGKPYQPGTSFDDFDSFPLAASTEPYDWQRDEWKRKR